MNHHSQRTRCFSVDRPIDGSAGSSEGEESREEALRPVCSRGGDSHGGEVGRESRGSDHADGPTREAVLRLPPLRHTHLGPGKEAEEKREQAHSSSEVLPERFGSAV